MKGKLATYLILTDNPELPQKNPRKGNHHREYEGGQGEESDGVGTCQGEERPGAWGLALESGSKAGPQECFAAAWDHLLQNLHRTTELGAEKPLHNAPSRNGHQ